MRSTQLCRVGLWLRVRSRSGGRGDETSRRGLAPIDDVLHYNITDAPWLAADSMLAPVPTNSGLEVFPTGAWTLEDSTPLAPEIAEFLAKGAPPIYLGFGSMPAPEGASRTLVDAARAVGRRAILSRGWADLDLIDEAPDCIAVGDVSHQALSSHAWRRWSITAEQGPSPPQLAPAHRRW